MVQWHQLDPWMLSLLGFETMEPVALTSGVLTGVVLDLALQLPELMVMQPGTLLFVEHSVGQLILVGKRLAARITRMLYLFLPTRSPEAFFLDGLNSLEEAGRGMVHHQ